MMTLLQAKESIKILISKEIVKENNLILENDSVYIY